MCLNSYDLSKIWGLRRDLDLGLIGRLLLVEESLLLYQVDSLNSNV